MGMSREELTKLKVAALFHDIGKIGVRDAVLTKEGKLTDDEFKDIKSHTIVGCDILSPVTMLQKVIPGIKHHHEKYDGRGYPDGLAGEDIPLLARILTVADSFDAMTSNRSYQRKRSFDDALLEVERCSGTQFDPAIASCFIQEVRKHYKNIERMIDFWNHIHKFGKEYEIDETAEQLAAAATEE
jgi:putative nucleotidyltransferase with HDIG domain